MRRRSVRASAALLSAGAALVVAGCTPSLEGPTGSFEDGSARMTVTYRAEPDAEPASVEVTMDGTDCYVDSVGTHLGEDVSAEARAAHLETLADDVAGPIGFYAGEVSGLIGEDESKLSVVLPGDVVFVSREAIQMDDGAFEVTDLKGTVQRSTLGGVVAEEASATGSFVCGTTTRFGR